MSMLKRIQRKVSRATKRTNKPNLSVHGFSPISALGPDDVHLIGYPKSGTTLLQHIVAHLVFGLRGDVPKRLIHLIVTEFYSNPYYVRLDDRCYFKSHERPRPDLNNVIYIVRDGRDALLSMFHMWRNTGRNISMDRLFSSGGGEYFKVSWAQHVNDWLENPFNAQLLLVKYEDLLTDKAQQISRIAEFLGLERSDQDIADVVGHTSMTSMRDMEDSFSWRQIKQAGNWREGTYTVRDGRSGSYIDEVPPEFIDQFVDIHGDLLAKFDYL